MGKIKHKAARKVTSDLRERGASAKREFRQRLKWLFGNACVVCGYNRTLKALEFHHIDPDSKRYSVSQGVKNYEWDDVVREAMKCVLVCANCHRELEDEVATLEDAHIEKQHRIIAKNLKQLPDCACGTCEVTR